MTEEFREYKGFVSLPCEDISIFKTQLIQWANQFGSFSFLDSNESSCLYSRYEFLCGVDLYEELPFDCDTQADLNEFLFGTIEYIGNSSFCQTPFIKPLGTSIFRARYVFYGFQGRIYCNRNILEALAMLDQIQRFSSSIAGELQPINFESKTSEDEYIVNVKQLQDQIREGIFYELNYCIAFEAEEVVLEPLLAFHKINQHTKAPMTALVKNNDQWVLSFSPERYIQHRNGKLIAQPIKGTIKRNLENNAEDALLKNALSENRKDRAENTMIVDLMRNDLASYARTGSIQVPEYCEVYSFNTVHQMISTVTADLSDRKNAIRALFSSLPAASMTGAPKKIVVKTISEIENFNRGLYSGHIGYVAPNGDYDFSVVIRTLQYDTHTKRAAIHAGSAITLLSDAESEYEECILKTKAIVQFFK